MSNSGAVHVEEEAGVAVAPLNPESDSIPRANLPGRWMLDHLDALAMAVVASGFVLRILAASRSYLNPDEALHYLLLNQSSAYLAYKASLTNAHPPLIYLLVYYWHFLGRSELMLRLPSAVEGTAFCWLLYKWMGLAFGRAASWIGLVLATYLPSMVALSAELRAYAVLLFCMAGALYFLERAFAEKSVRAMWAFTAFLYLAILSHYSAVFFAAAAGVYVLARIVDGQLPRKAIVAWAAGQAGALAILAFLYVTHVSKLKSSIAVWSLGFDTTYFHKDSMLSIFAFTGRNTFNVFLFLFAQRYIAQAMLICFVAGVAIFIGRGLLSSRESLGLNRLGLLLILPAHSLRCGARPSLGFIPWHIGSRHTVFLAPFANRGRQLSAGRGFSRQKAFLGCNPVGSAPGVCLQFDSSIRSDPGNDGGGNPRADGFGRELYGANYSSRGRRSGGFSEQPPTCILPVRSEGHFSDRYVSSGLF